MGAIHSSACGETEAAMGSRQQISWERTGRNWNITHTDTVVLQCRLRSPLLPSFLLLLQSLGSSHGAHTPGKDLYMSHVPRFCRGISTVSWINTGRSLWRGSGGFTRGDGEGNHEEAAAMVLEVQIYPSRTREQSHMLPALIPYFCLHYSKSATDSTQINMAMFW